MNLTLTITYANGITQHKEVIEQSVFDNVILPNKKRLHLLKTLKQTPEIQNEIKWIQQILEPYNFPFCTNGSPIFKSVETGLLELGENQGGTHIVQSSLSM